MKFIEFAGYLDRLEKTSSRIKITEILAELFKKAEKSEIDKIAYLSLGLLAPRYEGVVFNIAERMMLRVIAQAFKQSLPFQGKKDLGKVRELYRKKGDLGAVAGDLASGKGKGLSVIQVYDKLVKIAGDEGEGSQERKIKDTAELLSSLDPLSVRFVARIPVGNLRLGFSDKTILDALSWMEVGDKSKKAKLERAYQVIPDVGKLARRVKEVGIDKASSNVKPVVGVPVLPMLAQRLKSPAEMIEKMGKVFVEPKFDGLRVLIHFKRQKPQDFIRAYTRNLNNVADMFLELKKVGKFINANEVILDTEAVGMDPEMMRLADFQTTMQRRRKYDIEAKSREIPLRFQVFDIMLKDGKSLMETPYNQRRKVLEKTLKKGNLLLIDDAILTDNPEVIKRLHKEKVSQGLEGVILKKYDTPYIPGRTGWRWVKMKEEEEAVSRLSDTVDCVVMGYYSGRGKRAQFGLGGFLVGVLDGEVIKTITKIGTGLSDEQFREMYIRLKKLQTKDKPKEYGEVNKILHPDFWVKQSLVVEVAADEITKSPNHSSGLALRFPRLVRFRDDKSPSEATTISEVKKLYILQRS